MSAKTIYHQPNLRYRKWGNLIFFLLASELAFSFPCKDNQRRIIIETKQLLVKSVLDALNSRAEATNKFIDGLSDEDL
jgi:hypothetical protein